MDARKLLGFLFIILLVLPFFVSAKPDGYGDTPVVSAKEDTILFTSSSKTTETAYITKYDAAYSDRLNTYVSISVSSTEKKISISDPINSVGATVYLPVKEVEAKLGSPPYGMYDQRYYPEKISKNLVDYYVFKIPHFSSVDITDWFDSDYASRIPVTFFDTDNQGYSDDWDNGISVFYLTDSNVLDGDDQYDDIKIVALDNDGGSPEVCAYDAWVWDTANDKAWIAVKHWIDESSDTIIYLYYDYSGAGDPDNDNISGVYTNGKGIYHFEETSGNLTDWSGQGYTGTPSGSIDQTYTGFSGNCYDFDGSDDYVDLNDLDLASSFTILSWVNCDDVAGSGTTGDTVIAKLSSDGASANKNYVLMIDSGWTIQINTTVANYGGGASASTWQYVGGRWSGTAIQFYFQGVASGSSANISSAPSNNYDARIGYFGEYTSNRKFNGRIDELWIFTDSKSDDFIEHLYRCFNDGTTDYYTVGSSSALPTFAITESPINTTYSSPSSLDINVTITNGTGITFEEANFSYYDGSWHTIKNSVTSLDGDIKTWSSSKIAFRWDSTNNWPSTNQDDIKVRATVLDGTTVYSACESATFDITFNSAPNAPTITSVGGVSTNSTAYDQDTATNGFLWYLKGYNTSDPDGDNLQFKWEIDDSADFGSVVVLISGLENPADINCSTSYALTKNGYYYVRLGAIDPDGSNTYTYSNILKIYLEDRNPVAPTLSSPADLTSTGDTTPDVEWTGGSDPDGDTLTWRIQFDDENTFTTPFEYDTGFGASTSPHTVGSALGFDTFYWRVGVAAYGVAAYSDYRTITITPNSAPSITENYSEPGAAVSGSITIPYTLTDTEEDTCTLEHEYWDSNSSAWVYASMGIGGDGNTSLTSSSGGTSNDWVWDSSTDIPNAHLVNTKIRLRATGTGAGDWEETGTFTVDNRNSAPTIPTLSTPTNWATGQDTNLDLNWTDSTDTEADAFTYTLYIESVTPTGHTITKTGLASSAYTTDDLNLLDCALYKWTVKSVQTDNGGTLGYAAYQYFQTSCGTGGGTGSTVTAAKVSAAYDKSSNRMELMAWYEEAGVAKTGISDVTITVRDDTNATVHTSTTGTVFADGVYRATWTPGSVLHGLYSMKITLTYDGSGYTGIGYYDAGSMEVQDTLTTMTTRLNNISSYTDSLEANVNASYTLISQIKAKTDTINWGDVTSIQSDLTTLKGYTDSLEGDMTTIKNYIGDPADTGADSTLFGYGQYLKDKWGTYSATSIYNKIDDTYTLAGVIDGKVDSIQVDITALQIMLTGLDTNVSAIGTLAAGIDANVTSVMADIAALDTKVDALATSISGLSIGGSSSVASFKYYVTDDSPRQFLSYTVPNEFFFYIAFIGTILVMGFAFWKNSSVVVTGFMGVLLFGAVQKFSVPVQDMALKQRLTAPLTNITVAGHVVPAWVFLLGIIPIGYGVAWAMKEKKVKKEQTVALASVFAGIFIIVWLVIV